MTTESQAEIWERRYAESTRVWSGRPNRSLVEALTPLTPGRALELACGEGADSIWLAEQGWQVTAVDISPTAIRRAGEHAQERGLEVDWQVADLADWTPKGSYDLVVVSFLHTPPEFPRTEVMQRAAAAVVPDGHLFVLGHAEAPPWARHHDGPGHSGPHGLIGPDEEIAGLALGERWQPVLAEVREREGTGPDGTTGVLKDSVVLLRRTA